MHFISKKHPDYSLSIEVNEQKKAYPVQWTLRLNYANKLCSHYCLSEVVFLHGALNSSYASICE